MGEIIQMFSIETMSERELAVFYRLTEDNAEASITAMRGIMSVLKTRQPMSYDDFHDVFPEDAS